MYNFSLFISSLWNIRIKINKARIILNKDPTNGWVFPSVLIKVKALYKKMPRNKIIIHETPETFFVISSFPISFLYTKKTKFKFKLLFKMKRDDKGRFSKSSEERLKLTLDFPPIKKIIIYLILGLVLLPWILLITKLNLS